MKFIPKLIALSLMTFLSINLALAHFGGKHLSPEERAKKQTDRLTEQLSLNTNQASQIAFINLEFGNKRHAVKENRTDREAAKTNMKKLRTEKLAAIKAVLNLEQMTKFDEISESRIGKGHRMGKGKKGKGRHVGHAGKGGQGQIQGTPEERAAMRTEKMTKHLALTPDQVSKVSAVNLAFAKKREAEKAKIKGQDSGRTAHKALRTEYTEAIKKLLTPVQLTKFEERGERKSGERKRGGKKGVTPEERAVSRTERMTEHLALIPAQIVQVKAINLSFAKKMEANKSSATDREVKKANRQTLRTEHANAIKEILTAAQITKFNEREAGKRGGKKGSGKKGGKRK